MTATSCRNRRRDRHEERVPQHRVGRHLRVARIRTGQRHRFLVTITDKRKKAYVFSDPYYEVHQAVVVAKDSAIKKPEDLKGKKVGVQIGTTAIEALRKMNVDIDLPHL